MTFIPFAKPLISNNEVSEVVETMKSGWLTTGKKTKQFEADFSKFVGVDYALAVNSATAGLHLGLEALGVGPGDKVITTVHTFTATAEVIRYLGADPIFVDIEADTFNIDCEEVEIALKKNPDVKVIIPVHFAGQSANMTEIMFLAKKYNVKVMEDAAHALPTYHKGKMIGTFGDITIFSFYANKTITTGEGGMVVTNNSDYAERISCMRLHGINRDIFDRFSSKKPSWYYNVIAPGFKYNMTDIAASIGIHQLKKAIKFQKMREEVTTQYNYAFKDLPLLTPYLSEPKDMHSWHLYIIQLDLDKLTINRDQFIQIMADYGIGTSVHYIPLHMHTYWKENYQLRNSDFPISTKVFSRIVSLPNFPGITKNELKKIISTVTEILTNNKKC